MRAVRRTNAAAKAGESWAVVLTEILPGAEAGQRACLLAESRMEGVGAEEFEQQKAWRALTIFDFLL